MDKAKKDVLLYGSFSCVSGWLLSIACLLVFHFRLTGVELALFLVFLIPLFLFFVLLYGWFLDSFVELGRYLRRDRDWESRIKASTEARGPRGSADGADNAD